MQLNSDLKARLEWMFENQPELVRELHKSGKFDYRNVGISSGVPTVIAPRLRPIEPCIQAGLSLAWLSLDEFRRDAQN
jgi:hypothetical protein